MIFRLELVTIPVSDVDRAKAFYVDQAGFTTEQDVPVDDEHRFVEFMPPGSPCSIALTTGYVDSEPGSPKGIQLNVGDADAAHAFLRNRGVQVTEIQTELARRGEAWHPDADGAWAALLRESRSDSRA